jgi:hypothetical protein
VKVKISRARKPRTALNFSETASVESGRHDLIVQLRVQRTLEQAAKVVTFIPPKTKRSERTITVG